MLKGRGFWDAHTIHKVGDKYVMFYLGNNLDIVREKGIQPAATQRIGLAIADSINGILRRISDSDPILDISHYIADWDSYLTTNPALFQHQNDQYWFNYKAWAWNNDKIRKMGLAIADNIEGPYKKIEENSIVSFSEIIKQVEDANIF